MALSHSFPTGTGAIFGGGGRFVSKSKRQDNFSSSTVAEMISARACRAYLWADGFPLSVNSGIYVPAKGSPASVPPTTASITKSSIPKNRRPLKTSMQVAAQLVNGAHAPVLALETQNKGSSSPGGGTTATICPSGHRQQTQSPLRVLTVSFHTSSIAKETAFGESAATST